MMMISNERLRALRALAKELATQDNAATAHPIFLVQEKRFIYGIDLDYDPPTHWVEKYEHEVFYSTTKEAVEAIRDDDTGWELQGLADSDIDPEDYGYEKVGYHLEWRYVCAHFTRTAAERYIEENAHNLKEPRVYVASQYRCLEWQLVVESLGAITGELAVHRAAQPLSGGTMINEKTPCGTLVDVIDDLGRIVKTKTRSDPWRLGDGTLVVLLEGKTGGYSAERCYLRAEIDEAVSAGEVTIGAAQASKAYEEGFAAGRESAAKLAEKEAADWRETATHEPGATPAWQRAVDKQNALHGFARHIREGRGI